MRAWSRTSKSCRLVRKNLDPVRIPVVSSQLDKMADDESVNNDNMINQQIINPVVRSMRDYLQPPRESAPSCLIFPLNAHNFRFKPGMINLLPTFHGLESENPYLHLREFEDVCATFTDQNVSNEVVKLKLFPFSLKDKAKTWLTSLKPRSIGTWREMQTEFLKKFFPTHKTNALKKQIQNFSQNVKEVYFQSWERFKDLLNACPHHGFEKWRYISFFYEGLTPESRQFVETMCNGEFLDKEPDEALDFLDNLADNSQYWQHSNSEGSIRSNLANAQRGVHHLSQENDLSARVACLTKKIEAMERRNVQEPKNEILCSVCQTLGHSTYECPNFKEESYEQVNYTNQLDQPRKPYPSPHSDTYNSQWRNHPNFSWRNDQSPPQQFHPPPQNFQNRPPFPQQSQNSHFQSNSQNFQRPPQNFSENLHSRVKSLEDILNSFIQAEKSLTQKQEVHNTRTSQDIHEIKESMSKLISLLSIKEKGKFPAQPVHYPSLNEVASSSSSPQETVNFVTTLRSGKTVDKIDSTLKSDVKVNSNEENSEKEKNVSKEKFVPKVPFPQALVSKEKVDKNAEIFELFKQVKINIPLLDAIKQVPSYAKFLKDLCTVKRKHNVTKTAFLTENVSSIIQHDSPPKFKDPGCPTISCVIGNIQIEHALLDLGASVNLLPYSVYQQLGLGELKPTPVTLQLADRSVKIPRGIVEDVLVQIDKFYYPVDFIVLDTQPVANTNVQIPVILGRPFLATSNALINCRNGILKLSFGNMTSEFNIFNMAQSPSGNCEVNVVESSNSGMFDDPLADLANSFALHDSSQVENHSVNNIVDQMLELESLNFKHESENEHSENEHSEDEVMGDTMNDLMHDFMDEEEFQQRFFEAAGNLTFWECYLLGRFRAHVPQVVEISDSDSDSDSEMEIVVVD